MDRLTRRSVLRASAGLAAAGAIARPFIANAEAKTATVLYAKPVCKAVGMNSGFCVSMTSVKSTSWSFQALITPKK